MRAPAAAARATSLAHAAHVGAGIAEGDQRGIGRFPREHRCDRRTVADRKEGSARNVPVIGPGVEVPVVVAERRSPVIAGQPAAKQRQVVSEAGIHEGDPDAAGVPPLRPRSLQGFGPFQRLEVAFQLVEVSPGRAVRPDRPTGPDGAPAIRYRLNGRTGALAVASGVGNPKLAKPTPELPPLDGELVGARQQKPNHDTPRIPVLGGAGSHPATNCRIAHSAHRGRTGRAAGICARQRDAANPLRPRSSRRTILRAPRPPRQAPRSGGDTAWQSAARQAKRAAGKKPRYIALLGTLTPASL